MEFQTSTASTQLLSFRLSSIQLNSEKEAIEAEDDPLDVPYIEAPFHCDYGYNIRYGRNIYINTQCTILDCAQVTIGNDVMIGPGVKLFCPGHPLDADLRKTPGALEFALPIHIGNDVWIGGGSVILGGITISDRAVIAAGSVVTKHVPSDTLVAGNPARIIRTIQPGELGLPKRYYEQKQQQQQQQQQKQDNVIH
jgi:maltose O-acetyltransferase